MGIPFDVPQSPGVGRVLLATFFVVTAPILVAQSRREEFLNVKSWRGSFDMSVNTQSESNGVKLTFQGTVSGQLVHDTPDLASTRWLGKIQSSTVNVRAELTYPTGTMGKCTVTSTYLFSGPLDPYRSTVETQLRVFLNVWDMRITRNTSGGGTRTRRTVCPDSSRTEVDKWTAVIPTMSGLEFPYPPQGLSLEGRGKAPATGILDSSIPSQQVLSWDVHFRLEPAVDDLLLEVTPSQYDGWRPTAEPGPKAGKPIELTATVKRASGETAQVKVSRFVWELVDTSREPGIAINFPLSSWNEDPDLEFDPQKGQFVTGADNQIIERPAPESAHDSAVVLPYDWGAWSTLQVTAFLPDGGKLIGRLKGSQEDGVRLPKRAKDSYIADAWRDAGRGRNGKDDSDDETDPEGDGSPGDGLTLYEEYRGFYEDGAHDEGNAAKKDYFAFNAAGSMGDGGLIHFGRITGLNVHYNLNQSEFDVARRVINGNHSAAPHRVDQHGVWLKNGVFDGYAEAVTGGSRPSTPKDFLYVGLPVSMPSRSTASAATSYASVTIAHEMLHTVNVWHHGEADRTVVWQRSGGLLLELGSAVGAGAPIRVFREDGTEATAAMLERLADGGSISKYLGVKNSQHSGYEDCVTRYDVAEAYVSEVNPSDRYLVRPAEIPGAHLCDTREGVAVNADGRTPQPRYSWAASNRGGCKRQIVVNDGASAPGR
jgi:hypothetical protein